VHGSPLHIGALDDAGDYFHDTFGGVMVNLWGLLPVLSGWGNAMSGMTAAEKKADGVSLHAGADEHSMMLYLRPDLVSPDYRGSKPFSGANYADAFATARRAEWPGYLGAPNVASAALGRTIWQGFSSATITTAVEILDGKDPASYPRYLAYLVKLPEYQDWIARANHRDSAESTRQKEWLLHRRR
jgi:hypothetical protein